MTNYDIFQREQAGLPVKSSALLTVHAFGGDPSAPSVAEQTGQMSRALTKNLPNVSSTISNQILPVGQATQNAQNILSPQQQALQAQLYAQYAPILNSIGQGIANSNQTNQVQVDSSLLNGEGQNAARGLAASQAILDPEFYQNRATIGAGVNNLLSGLGNPNELSGGERAETERSINRDRTTSGNNGVQSGIGTVQSAVTFGDALNKRRNNFMGLLGSGANTTNSLRSGQDAFGVATGRGASTQFGSNQFTGATDNGATGNAFNLGSNMLGQIGTAQGNTANINANKRDNLDRVNETMGSMPSYS